MKRRIGFALAALALGLCGAMPAFAAQSVTVYEKENGYSSTALESGKSITPPGGEGTILWESNANTITLNSYDGGPIEIDGIPSITLKLFGYCKIQGNIVKHSAITFSNSSSGELAIDSEAAQTLEIRSHNYSGSYAADIDRYLKITGNASLRVAKTDSANGINARNIIVGTNGEVRIEPTENTIGWTEHTKGVLFIGRKGTAKGYFRLVKTITVNNLETLEIAPDADVAIQVNSARINVQKGGRLIINGTLDGDLTNDGRIDINDGATLKANLQGEGTVYTHGSGTFIGDLGENKLYHTKSDGSDDRGEGGGGCATGALGLAGLAALALFARSKKRGR